MDVRRGLGTIRNLDYVVLLCDDLPAMRHFYTAVMGFEEHQDLPPGTLPAEHWLALKVGSSLLALRPRGRSPSDGPGPGTASASVQLALRVPPAEVAVAAEQLKAQGVEILGDVTDQPFGHRPLFFTDPEHNIIEIYAEI